MPGGIGQVDDMPRRTFALANDRIVVPAREPCQLAPVPWRRRARAWRPSISRLGRMNESLRFPDGFLFGASISAYQTEGGNVNTDWWWWEHLESTPCREPSGDACDFYHRYAEDVAMLAGAGLNCFRFGVAWARIEPAEGESSRAALAHYRRMLDACHEHGVAPIVTLHHFTVPRWLHEQGGLAAEKFHALLHANW